MSAKIVFMGSPDFALPSLLSLSKNYPIAGVVTQPDRPAGRGRVLTQPPVKRLAQELGLKVIQPRRLSDPIAMRELKAWAPDLIVVAAFGQILRADVLTMPEHGCINVHASLLPRWRGAAPVHAALLHGDEDTGVTIMRMDEGIDTGPILSQRIIPILPNDTALTLSARMSEHGAELLLETLPPYLRGELSPEPQTDAAATYAPMLKKGDGELDFSQKADELVNKVRAFNPWPGAFTQWQGARLKIHRAHAAESDTTTPGRRRVVDGFPAVETQKGFLVLDEVQPAGKKAMPGDVFLRGAKDW